MINEHKLLNVAAEYRNAKPFPHCIIDNLWDGRILAEAEREAKLFNDWDGEKKFYGSVGKRFCGTIEKLPPTIQNILTYCNSSVFLQSLQVATGEKGLIPDPYFEGGGLHSTINRGYLKMHADFNWHERLSLYRRINLLVYLNSEWREEWGGDLRLATKDGSGLSVASQIFPLFNRTVIFTTTDHSYHGHPDPLLAPSGIARNSLALYYYISGKPLGTAEHKRTGTDYRNYDGTSMDTIQDEGVPVKLRRKLKSLLRRLS